jgi:hypothetical protein
MSDKKLTDNKKESAKDIMLKEIVDQLTKALPSLKEKIGEKKFEKRIKKAAKLLTEGIKNSDSEKEPKTKAAAPKKAPVKIKVAAPAKKAAKIPSAK